MNIFFFSILLLLLQFLCFGVARKYAGKNKSQEDYFFAERKLSFFPLMMTFVATQVGGGLVLGSAEEAFRYGWSVLLYPLGATLGLLLLSLGVGQRLASFNVPTVASLFEKIYGSKGLRKIASLLSILSLFMIFIGQLVASRKFMVSLGVEGDLLFLAFWSIVILYTVFGGFKAVVATDIVQALFFLLVFSTALLWSLFSEGYTLQNLVLEAPAASDKWVGWLLMPLLFMVIEQDMAQRCFAADSRKTVSLAALSAGIATLLICAIPVFFGISAQADGLTPVPGSSVLMTFILGFSSSWIAPFIGVAILAAIISTADSLLNAVTSNISQDFFPSQKKVSFSQGITLGLGAFGLLASYFFTNVVDTLILSYELSVSSLFIPVFFALIKKKGHYLSGLLSVLFGALAFLLFHWISPPLGREVLSLLLSLLGFCLGELISWTYGKKIRPQVDFLNN